MYRRNKIIEAIRCRFTSYNKFAQSVGVDRSAITKYLNGARTPHYRTAQKIIRVLENSVTLEDIYGPEEDK